MGNRMKEIPFARLDFSRKERTGFGETVFGAGKTPEQLADIFSAFAEKRLPVLATRVTKEQADTVAATGLKVKYDPAGRLLELPGKTKRLPGRVAVLTGGTADIPVAEECAGTVEFFGGRVDRFFDVGVAGLHRLLGVIDDVRTAPVVAVPTSVGYGAGAGGVAAALAMLNSCAEGVSVVNIDNGFGAAVVACRMLRRMKGKKV